MKAGDLGGPGADHGGPVRWQQPAHPEGEVIDIDARTVRDRFLAWLERNPDTWMMLVWIPVLLVGPAIATIRTADPRGAVALVVTAGLFAVAVRDGGPWLLYLWRPLAISALASVASAALTLFGAAWVPAFGLLGVAAATAFGALGSAVTLALATVVGVVAAALTVPGALFSVVATTLLSGLGAYVIRRLVDANVELLRARRRLAHAAVAEERARFSRDLHDIAGHTLSVMVVKAETTRRLIPVDPDAAAGHAADIERIGREALHELRDAVAGYRGPTLSAELERVRTALAAAGVELSASAVPEGMPRAADALAAAVVREATTNVIRHAGATTCTIVVEPRGPRLVVEVSDDGRGGPLREGAGLAGLRERLADAGGTLRVDADRGVRVRAEVPLR